MTLYRLLLRDLDVRVDRRDLVVGLAAAPLVIAGLVAMLWLLAAVVPS